MKRLILIAVIVAAVTGGLVGCSTGSMNNNRSVKAPTEVLPSASASPSFAPAKPEALTGPYTSKNAADTDIYGLADQANGSGDFSETCKATGVDEILKGYIPAPRLLSQNQKGESDTLTGCTWIGNAAFGRVTFVIQPGTSDSPLWKVSQAGGKCAPVPVLNGEACADSSDIPQSAGYDSKISYQWRLANTSSLDDSAADIQKFMELLAQTTESNSPKLAALQSLWGGGD